jgi:hypothetical protein
MQNCIFRYTKKTIKKVMTHKTVTSHDFRFAFAVIRDEEASGTWQCL